MKKTILSILATAVFLSGSVQAHATAGDVCGHIYSTDINAFINGVQVDSYSIDGKTVVILEDITDLCQYVDSLRTLVLAPKALAPQNLKPAQTVNHQQPGAEIGEIYESDISVYFFDQKLPAYSLNGKMAVALEDLGLDGDFSDLGGRYIWNPEERTIALDLVWDNLYSESQELLKEKNACIVIDADGHTTFERELFQHNYRTTMPNRPLTKVTAETERGEETIGYFLSRPYYLFFLSEEGEYTLYEETATLIEYMIPGKLAAVLENIDFPPPTRQERITYYEEQSFYTTINSLETDAYTFLYMFLGTPHGGIEVLRRIAADGSEICYDAEFQPVSLFGIKSFDHVHVDRENEKVYFRYDKDYIIDLRTGQLLVQE